MPGLHLQDQWPQQRGLRDPGRHGMVIENDTPQLTDDRRAIIEMLFVEGNHPCPYCVASGDCELQALGYRLGMVAPHQPYQWPGRKIDATHPDIYLDHDRCILCSRCIAPRGWRTARPCSASKAAASPCG
jgi:NADH dehydrogenase/NADH:ubiquinone oxidoreductase subunit G